jgi:hypothetical protein
VSPGAHPRGAPSPSNKCKLLFHHPVTPPSSASRAPPPRTRARSPAVSPARQQDIIIATMAHIGHDGSHCTHIVPCWCHPPLQKGRTHQHLVALLPRQALAVAAVRPRRRLLRRRGKLAANRRHSGRRRRRRRRGRRLLLQRAAVLPLRDRRASPCVLHQAGQLRQCAEPGQPRSLVLRARLPSAADLTWL